MNGDPENEDIKNRIKMHYSEFLDYAGAYFEPTEYSPSIKTLLPS